MAFNPQIHHRRSIRLKGYDYSQAGLYFVTICIKNRECLFGHITNGEMILNDAGQIANEYLKNISKKYVQTQMHEFVVMPNHIHAIIEITGSSVVGAIHESPDTQIIDTGAIYESPGTPIMQTGAIHESPLRPNGDASKSELSLRDQRRKMLLSKIIGWYKMNTAKQINIIRQTEGVPLWQRDFHDHIIRNEQSYQTISGYIINNPQKWNDDKFYSE